jgi:hypothetical protein
MSFLALHLRTQIFRALLTYQSLEDQSLQFACVVLTCTYFGAIVAFHACQYKHCAPYSRINDADLKPSIDKPASETSRTRLLRAYQRPHRCWGYVTRPKARQPVARCGRRAAHGHVHAVARRALGQAQSASSSRHTEIPYDVQ